MRSNILIYLVGILFIVLTDTLLFIQIRKLLRKKRAVFFYWIHSLLFILGLTLYHFIVPRLKGPESYYWIGVAIGILFLFYAPKVIFILLNVLASIGGLLNRKIQKAGRRIATVCALFLFLILLYSTTWGRYNFKITTREICFTNLPEAFNQFKIVQLTDLHLGSLPSHYAGISRLVEEVNALHPDLILFTGDMVNNFASELVPWIGELGELKAKYGKFAVTGNHDYGNYTRWSSPEKQKQNGIDFFRNMKAAGFTMLNNTHRAIPLKGDTIYIAGVENWGNPPFPRYGKLKEAIAGIQDHFIILLSHDPSHWRAQVLDAHIPLTLSGHTHAMQMGIKVGKYKWSPAQYIYPEYDGLYQNQNQYLNVSRGQGYLGFPGRIGLRPEITVLILTNKCR